MFFLQSLRPLGLESSEPAEWISAVSGLKTTTAMTEREQQAQLYGADVNNYSMQSFDA